MVIASPPGSSYRRRYDLSTAGVSAVTHGRAALGARPCPCRRTTLQRKARVGSPLRHPLRDRRRALSVRACGRGRGVRRPCARDGLPRCRGREVRGVRREVVHRRGAGEKVSAARGGERRRTSDDAAIVGHARRGIIGECPDTGYTDETPVAPESCHHRWAAGGRPETPDLDTSRRDPTVSSGWRCLRPDASRHA